ncbi:MAG TPA: hypothetical protein VMW35_05440 [Myxococcota bacterium]|nr:hypothetical protein [Myxococcota bacterium]
MRLWLVLSLAIALAAPNALALTLSMPATTLVLDAPDVGNILGARYTVPSTHASAFRPWTVSQPVTLTISPLTFDFSESSPYVTIAPFAITMSPVHVEAALPYGIVQTLVVTAWKDPQTGFFPGGVSGIAPETDGTIRLTLLGADVFQTTTFDTPVGSDIGDGMTPWMLTLSLRNITAAGAELAFDRVGTASDGGYTEGDLNGVSIYFDMTGPGGLSNVTGLTLVPEPSGAMLLVWGIALLTAAQRGVVRRRVVRVTS